MTGTQTWYEEIDGEYKHRSRLVDEHVERLFAYGTLNYPDVQKDIWGEIMDEAEDVTLKGYRRVSLIAIVPDKEGEVEGKLYYLTPAQLKKTDEYEGSAYRRLRCLFPDQETAWVYVPRQNLVHLMTHKIIKED